MAQDAVINGTTYPAVEAVALTDGNGNVTQYYPDAVRYVAQTLTEAQKAQARENIGAISELDVPVKGVDYWTDADQEEIVQQVIAALGTPVFGRVDADNNIILTGELVGGTYTVKYEDAEGNVTEIGLIELAPAYNNMIPLSIDSDGTPYNGGQGWKNDYRLNSSGAETARAGMQVTGFIPAKYNDILRMRDITFNYLEANSAYRDNTYLAFYDASFTFLGYHKTFSGSVDTGACDIVINEKTQALIGLSEYVGSNAENVAYIRISATGISNNSVITINEEITD